MGGDVIEVSTAGAAERAAGDLAEAGFEGVAVQGAALRITADQGERVLPRVLELVARSAGIRSVTLRRPGLNDAFLQLTGRELRD